jgi:hypothetical protein
MWMPAGGTGRLLGLFVRGNRERSGVKLVHIGYGSLLCWNHAIQQASGRGLTNWILRAYTIGKKNRQAFLFSSSSNCTIQGQGFPEKIDFEFTRRTPSPGEAP